MEQGNVKKSRRYFDQQFKFDAVRLLSESGKPTSEVAKELGVNRNQLDRWKRSLGKKGPQAAFPGNGNIGADKKELEELRRELARVKEEREILKKSYGRILTTAVMKYAFISEYAHEHPIVLMCKVLNVSRSGFYRFRHHIIGAREIANVRLLEEIKRVHQTSRGIYGSPRVHRELNNRGNACGRHRVARLMAKEGIVAKVRRRYRVTTRQREGATYVPDLLKRNFTTERPHQVWTSDITYVWTTEGWLYLAVILDLFSRAIVGWSTSERIDSHLVCTAFRRALWQYRPQSSVIIHSDRGSQYTSRMFRALLAEQQIPILQSNGSSCYDNAVTESFFHTLKTESVDFEHYQSRVDAHQHLFDYIEVFYNQQRLHSSLGYHTPEQTLQEINNKKAA